MAKEKLNTKGCSPNSGLCLSESEMCLREMPQLGRENCFWCQLQWQENRAGNRPIFVCVFDNLKPLENNWTFDMSFPKCYSSRKKNNSTGNLCITSGLWGRTRSSTWYRELHGGGHCQPHTGIDIRVLVPLPSCCHFMLWEQCNGVLKG